MNRGRPLLGLLGALLFSLPTGFLAWWLTRERIFTGLAGITGSFLAWLGFRLLTGRQDHWLAPTVSALLPPLAALPGIWYGYGARILAQNQIYGCTPEEAMELIPLVVRDPYNRSPVLRDFSSPLVLSLLTAILLAKYAVLKKEETKNKR